MGLLMGSTGCLECHPIYKNSGKMCFCGKALPVNKPVNIIHIYFNGYSVMLLSFKTGVSLRVMVILN